MTHRSGWRAVDQDSTGTRGGIGESAARPDGTLKVRGEFAYSSDLWLDEMLCGVDAALARTRAPGSPASTSAAALAVPGVLRGAHPRGRARARSTTASSTADQPVLAIDEVRYQGEPVAIVAADHPRDRPPGAGADRGRLRGAAAGDRRPRAAVRRPRARRCTPAATWCATCGSGTATRSATADVVVTGEYEVGMQDQAFLGPESGLAVPAERRRRRPVRRHPVAARRPRPGRRRASACRRRRCGSRWPASAARSAPARTSRCRSTRACSRCTPAGRCRWSTAARSRSSATCTATRRGCATSTAPTATAGWSTSRRTIVLDGGAYASSTHGGGRQRRVARRRALRGAARRDRRLRRLHQQPAVRRDARLRRGAGLLRATSRRWTARRGARPGPGRRSGSATRWRRASMLATGQVHRLARPRSPSCCAGLPRPAAAARPARAVGPPRRCPAGVANTTHGEGVRRGVGYGVGHQEHLLLRGLRRLLDRPGAAARSSAASRSSPCTPPRPRSARGS